MKKLLIVPILLFTLKTFSQNVQLHYDFGEDREYLTSTIEMFRPDSLGNTFFFVDFDHNSKDVKGVSLGYMEIAREFNIKKTPLALHAEFNGGLGQFKTPMGSGGFSINNAWLGGITYSLHAKDFSKGISFQTLYKYIKDKEDVSFQLTMVWYWNLLDGKISFSGFADFWKEENILDGETTDYVFISEPQIWYNLNKNFSLGGEIELANNFGGKKGFQACPTLGARWTF